MSVVAIKDSEPHCVITIFSRPCLVVIEIPQATTYFGNRIIDSVFSHFSCSFQNYSDAFYCISRQDSCSHCKMNSVCVRLSMLEACTEFSVVGFFNTVSLQNVEEV